MNAFDGSIREINESGIFELTSLESHPEVYSGTRALKLSRPSHRDYLYLSFREATGYSSNLSTHYTRGVNLHRYRGQGFAATTFITSLTNGASFTDRVNPISVEQLTPSSEGKTITVAVSLGRENPTLEPDPVEPDPIEEENTIAPTPPASITVTQPRKNQILVQWSASSEEETGVAHYRIYRNSGSRYSLFSTSSHLS
jgi:hypothetical protein